MYCVQISHCAGSGLSDFLPTCLPSFFLSYFHLCFIPSSLITHCVWPREKKPCWSGSCAIFQQAKLLTLTVYLIVFVRHKDLSFSLTHLSNFFLALRRVDIQAHLLKWNGMKREPSILLKVRAWESFWERKAQNCVWPEIRWQS